MILGHNSLSAILKRQEAIISTDICKLYLEALNRGDLDLVLSLFTHDAVVHSPLYGQMTAKDFYENLFTDTSDSKTTVIDILISNRKKSSIALHFNYEWTLKSGKAVNFECVDIFKLCPVQNKFVALKIIYDTYHLREDHFESKRLSDQ